MLVGKHMREFGEAHTAQYGAMLRAAVRSMPSEIVGKQIDPKDKDRYVPMGSYYWVWRHCHLRRSDDGKHWFCNECAWDVPILQAGVKEQLGIRKWSSQTSNMVTIGRIARFFS